MGNWSSALGSDLGGVERLSLSGFTEYNFNRSSNIVPYVGASVGITDFNFDNLGFTSTLRPGDDTANVFGIQTGIKWFLRPHMAVTTSISFNVSSGDIY